MICNSRFRMTWGSVILLHLGLMGPLTATAQAPAPEATPAAPTTPTPTPTPLAPVAPTAAPAPTVAPTVVPTPTPPAAPALPPVGEPIHEVTSAPATESPEGWTFAVRGWFVDSLWTTERTTFRPQGSQQDQKISDSSVRLGQADRPLALSLRAGHFAWHANISTGSEFAPDLAVGVLWKGLELGGFLRDWNWQSSTSKTPASLEVTRSQRSWRAGPYVSWIPPASLPVELEIRGSLSLRSLFERDVSETQRVTHHDATGFGGDLGARASYPIWQERLRLTSECMVAYDYLSDKRMRYNNARGESTSHAFRFDLKLAGVEFRM